MQQRQLRLGDILDDYCPRERRVTNHAVVAMIGTEVKQTRCTTCDAEHEFKHAKVPRQRRKADPAALYSQVLAGGPKRVTRDVIEPHDEEGGDQADAGSAVVEDAPNDVEQIDVEPQPVAAAPVGEHSIAEDEEPSDEPELDTEQGPAHRRLIRATLPRPEGQPPPTRPAPEFTIRQPNTRQGRFRPRHQRGPSPFHAGPNGNRSGNFAGGMPRPGDGRPPMMSRAGKRHGHGGRKRSK